MLPGGSTLGQTTAAAIGLERAVRSAEGVERYWTSINPGNASVAIDVKPAWQDAQHIQSMLVELKSDIPATAGEFSYATAKP